VDPEEAFEELPLAHRVALRLAEIAVPDPQAAWVLGVEVEALGPLREVARRRLLRLQAQPPDPVGPGG
jgi:hypothetical protein